MKREKEAEKCIWTNNDWKLPIFALKKKNINLHIQEVQSTSSRIHRKKETHTYIHHTKNVRKLFLKAKLFKVKRKILKAVIEKPLVMYKNPVRWTTNFLLETRECRGDVVKRLYKKICQPNMWYPAKLPYKNESKVKILRDKQKLKESVASRPTLQEILKEVSQVESKWPLMIIQAYAHVCTHSHTQYR